MADEGCVSDLVFFAELLSTLQQASQGVRAISVQGGTGGSRSGVRALLLRALAACGCGAPVCTETETRLIVCFDLPAEGASAVYVGLVEAGLELTGDSHRELTRLCTVQSHTAEMFFLERRCTVRLEVWFREERRPGAVLAPAALA